MVVQQNSVLATIRSHAAGLKVRASRAPVRVLIVDDEPPILDFVGRVLRDAGYVTAVAASGADALRVAAELDHIDLLLTDFRMPQMNGDELARRLRAADPDLRVLYLTGFADHLFLDKGNLWDGEAYLDKPCSVKGLLEAVSLALCGHLVPNFADRV